MPVRYAKQSARGPYGHRQQSYPRQGAPRAASQCINLSRPQDLPANAASLAALRVKPRTGEGRESRDTTGFQLGRKLCRSSTAHGTGLLKNLPVFRWADFPVSLLSFVSRWSALRLVRLWRPHRRLRVTFNRSSSLLSMSVRSAFTSFRIPNGHGPCGAAFGRSPQDAAFQAAGGRRSMAPHAARPPGGSRKGASLMGCLSRKVLPFQ